MTRYIFINSENRVVQSTEVPETAIAFKKHLCKHPSEGPHTQAIFSEGRLVSSELIMPGET